MVWNKKGWSWQGVLVGLLLTLVAGGILMYFVYGSYYEWMLSLTGGGERQICKRSIELNAQRISFAGIKSDPFIDIRCKEIPVKIKEKDPEKIKKILANRLYWTWVDFGKGTKELFERGWFWGATYCKKRYVPISFEEEVEIDNFIEYLAKEKIGDVSYWEAITGSELSGDISELKDIPDRIDTNKEYMVVFMTQKRGFWEKWFTGISGAVAGGWVGKIVGGIIGGVVAILPVPGARVIAVTIIATTVVGGAAAGGISGFVLGTAFEDFTSSVALIPLSEYSELGCES